MVGDKDCRGNFMRHPAGVPGFISVRNKARVLCSLWSCWVFAVKFSRCEKKCGIFWRFEIFFVYLHWERRSFRWGGYVGGEVL